MSSGLSDTLHKTGSMENWKKGGMGNYAVVTEPITSLCERLL